MGNNSGCLVRWFSKNNSKNSKKKCTWWRCMRDTWLGLLNPICCSRSALGTPSREASGTDSILSSGLPMAKAYTTHMSHVCGVVVICACELHMHCTVCQTLQNQHLHKRTRHNVLCISVCTVYACTAYFTTQHVHEKLQVKTMHGRIAPHKTQITCVPSLVANLS